MRIALPFLLLLSLASSAAAQDEASAAEPPPEYDLLVSQALQESAEGRWSEARVLFRRAHEVFPNARTLRGIGMVSFELSDYADAIRRLRLALEDERRPLTDEQRQEAERIIERALGFVGSYSLEELPEGAMVRIDGREPVVEPDGAVLLSVGRHHAVVRSDGREGEARWMVRGGEREPLPVTLPAPSSAEQAAVARETAPPPVHPSPETRPLELEGPPVFAWALTIGGAVVAAVGIATFFLGWADKSEVEGASRGTEWDELSAANDRAPVLTGIGAALIGVGGAAALGGGIWIAGESGDEKSLAVHVGARGVF